MNSQDAMTFDEYGRQKLDSEFAQAIMVAGEKMNLLRP